MAVWDANMWRRWTCLRQKVSNVKTDDVTDTFPLKGCDGSIFQGKHASISNWIWSKTEFSVPWWLVKQTQTCTDDCNSELEMQTKSSLPGCCCQAWWDSWPEIQKVASSKLSWGKILYCSSVASWLWWQLLFTCASQVLSITIFKREGQSSNFFLLSLLLKILKRTFHNFNTVVSPPDT